MYQNQEIVETTQNQDEFHFQLDDKIISSKTKVVLEEKTGSIVAIISRPQRNIIHYLYENAGRILTKQQIKKIGWPGRMVSNSSVVVAISEIRSVFGDDKIITISGEGYMFSY